MPPTKMEKIDFEKKISKLVNYHKIDHIEAIVLYCEENNLEIEVAASLINSNLKCKIALDAQNLNLISKTKKLPI